ncbi:hypothetical protein J3459_007371 [Metarhizium acridum]|uniref:ATP-dependent RNA helicase DHX8 n=1 Tax=Metarhizium acridum (strain CQMa 102) TaxID=655827 RepID=E9DZJ5_METAQ|nr:uncharacterized protein MAC_03043 [Metarhizium acridum CQMa 102]EFY90927.1 hypothetical protein MAC_03043 [Metarhizium acridum CQMa 102]KAG8421258.1 hypothetical protein J3458_003149 [Metarhizium acridum]KAG8427256.1 hypothetical protein J3459_007371 [Metarhizium acridum]
MASTPPYRQIRATYTPDTITVYQAYKRSIADAAVEHQKLDASPDFRPGRMTWVKPSWGWMMYRAGYSYKDPGQERILALRMKHELFVALLEKGVLSAHTERIGGGGGEQGPRDKPSEVRIQWDPERDERLRALPYRSIQIGIPASLSQKWAEEWITEIEDVTEKARGLKAVLDERGDVTREELVDMGYVPEERVFEVSQDIRERLAMDLVGS